MYDKRDEHTNTGVLVNVYYYTHDIQVYNLIFLCIYKYDGL